MNKMRVVYRGVSTVLFAAVAGVIFYLSHQSAGESQELSDSLISLIISFFRLHLGSDLVRTLAHFSEYAALGFLTLNMLYSYRGKISLAASVIICALYSLSDEIHQIFIPGRAFQLSDLCIDCLGALLGIVLCLTFIRLYVKISDKRR